MAKSVFISYSRKDAAIAEYIAAELRARNCDVFIDYQSLQAGNFVQQLGHEIEKRDAVVLLLSPHSVESSWVQAEIAWAFTQKKPIVPVLLDLATSLVNMFVIANLQAIDFTRWSIDGKVDEGVRKLAKYLGLSEEPARNHVPREIVLSSLHIEPENLQTEKAPVTLATNDLAELFLRASEVTREDPEQAIFLYRQIHRISPNYMRGEVSSFIEREEKRLIPMRLALAKQALKEGKWKRATQIAQSVLNLDNQIEQAQEIASLAKKNMSCETIYDNAEIAVQKNRWAAALNFLEHVRKYCPDYGDPHSIVKRMSINEDTAKYLRDVETLPPRFARWDRYPSPNSNGDTSITLIKFVPNGNHLLVATNIMLHSWDVIAKKWSHVMQTPQKTLLSIDFNRLGNVICCFFGEDKAKWGNNIIDILKYYIDMETGQTQPELIFSGKNPLQTNKPSLYGQSTPITFYSSERDYILLSVKDRNLLIWKKDWNCAKYQYSFSTSTVSTACFSPDGQQILIGFENGNVTLVDFKSIPPELSNKAINWLRKSTSISWTEHRDRIKQAIFSPNGQIAVTLDISGLVKLWDVKRKALIGTITEPNKRITCVQFSSHGNLLIYGCWDGSLHIFNMATKTKVTQTKKFESGIVLLAMSANARWIASVSEDNEVKLWGLG